VRYDIVIVGGGSVGIGADSVVDPATMRVHGLAGLRVVDASAMPYVTNGNSYAPVMMLAEKSADLIAGNTPLAPIDAQFFRQARSGSTTTPGKQTAMAIRHRRELLR
jgi:choline dehydrogenase